MLITKEYLEARIAGLTQQAEAAAAVLQNANGAIAALRHLVAELEKDERKHQDEDE
jgi:hypothetical protein